MNIVYTESTLLSTCEELVQKQTRLYTDPQNTCTVIIEIFVHCTHVDK